MDILSVTSITAGGVDDQFITWVPSDGVGRTVRTGLNFTERGFGVRGAVGVSDRGHSAASQLRAEDIDVDRLFGQLGVRWLHTGGIYAALSQSSAQTAKAVMAAAHANGTVISYDLNYRPSLWKSIGGQEEARRVNRELARLVDVMIGNEEDFTACLGFEVEGNDENLSHLDVNSYATMIDKVIEKFPNISVVATTLRQVRTASRNDWSAIAWSKDTGLVRSVERPNLEILDRVGGGDSFAAGLVAGLMETGDLQKAVELGAAHGALAMTTPGDTSMVTRCEVESLAAGGSARVKR
ncbi:kinase, PfkB family [Cutibacterium acnes HL087PA2]|nr:kinase, PfkB family [Cutibacterium acnes HL087PA2]